MDKYVEWLITVKGRATMACLLVIVTVFMCWNIHYLAFDFELESFFPKDHPDSQLYEQHVAQFGYDNDFMQIILENKEGVFELNFLIRATAFEKSLHKISDVVQVYSPLSWQHVVKSPTGLIIFPLIHTEDPARLKQDSIRIFENELYRPAFTRDGKAVSIYLNHAHFDDPERSQRLLSTIRSKARQHGMENIRLVGKLSASNAFIQYIKNDFRKFLIGSLIVSFGLLLILFRNLKSAALPFLISLLSTVWLFGLIGLLGYKINLLSTLLPPIMFFVSMSDAVHLMNTLKQTKANGKKDRIMEALKVVWTPTLLTSVTTAIGFLSLLWINTTPVQLLGVFASVGILLAFVVTFTFGLLVASVTQFSSGHNPMEISRKLPKLLVKKKRLVFLGFAILAGALIPGVFQLKINSFLLDDFPEDSEIRQHFKYADDLLGGSKPYEIRVEVADTSLRIWDKIIMDEIVKIEQYLFHEYPIAKVQSPVTVIKYLNMVNNGGLTHFYQYPETDGIYKKIIHLKNRVDPKRMGQLVTEDGKVARLIGVFPELGSYETKQRNKKLMAYLNTNINKKLIVYRITGTTYLIDKSHELLSKNLLWGLVTAIGVIGIILGIYFRSWKLMVISLIPNLIPLILIAGILGWIGISLKMTTSIIFTISFGIAVDDTIHIMSHYLRNTNPHPLKRMEETLRYAGSAMLITSTIMIAGFTLFLFSNFGATFYLGLFISLSLTIALLIDLTILPLLLMSFQKNASNRG